MENSKALKVVEVCRVAPLPTSPDSNVTSHHMHESILTFLDLVWLRLSPVEPVFFYEIPSITTNPNVFYDSIVPKLKASLALALQHFLPLSGNLSWPQNSTKPILTFVDGDSVSVTIAESNAGNFHRLSSNDLVEANEYQQPPLTPTLEASNEKVAAMAIQITLFPNQGFSIGTAMHHAVLDGKMSSLFFKAWAHICKNNEASCVSLPENLTPFHDRTAIKDLKKLGELYSNEHLNQNGPNNRSVITSSTTDPRDDLVRGSFELTRANIHTLREIVVKKTSGVSDLHLSTFSIGCAYTWVCLVKSQDLKGENLNLKPKTGISIIIDIRSRMDPPVPETYFGNCLVIRVAAAETIGLTGQDGMVVALTAITEALRTLEDGILKGNELGISDILDVSMYDKCYTIAGSNRFEVYDTDFGWGRPNKFELVSIYKTGAVSFLDSKNGGGAVEVGLALKKPHMEIFASLFTKGLEIEGN